MNVKLMRCFIVLMLGAFSAQAQSVWDAGHLKEVRASVQSPLYSRYYQALMEEAGGLLQVQPLSVMMKDKIPASGDKHDYLSLARYWWPDSTKANGLPYINRDGVVNPEIYLLDRGRLGMTASRIQTLSLAWYFSGDERYARKATELVRVWFLDPSTRMNPNLEYAQVVPGRYGDKGRSYGLIDTYSFVEMLDAVALLEQSKAFTTKDSKRLKRWFAQLTDWMWNSPQGKAEGRNLNNHSVAYDAQVIAFSLYVGNRDLARQLLDSIPTKRLYAQIEPDGSQPRELRRTLAFHYSQYNLTHFIDMILMGKKLGYSIDEAVSADGRSFYKALDFLLPYVGKPSEWPYPQISGWEEAQQNFCKDLYRTAAYLNPARTDYREAYQKFYKPSLHDLFNLTYVKAAIEGSTAP